MVLREGGVVLDRYGRKVTLHSAIAVAPGKDTKRGEQVTTLTWTNAYCFGGGERKLRPFTQVFAPESAFDLKLGELLNQRAGKL